MQYVAGQSLEQARAQLSLPQKVQVIRDVAEALHEAHRQGIVHRDIKPASVAGLDPAVAKDGAAARGGRPADRGGRGTSQGGPPRRSLRILRSCIIYLQRELAWTSGSRNMCHDRYDGNYGPRACTRAGPV